MKYFYDTEFLEDGMTIGLISIGIVAEDGREYHAVNGSANWPRIWNHEWLSINVLPHLPATSTWKPRKQIRDEVKTFLLATPKTELWAWFGAYDHVALAQLFGRMTDLPKGIPMYTNDVRSLVDFVGIDRLPRQTGAAHDALEDARHVKTMYEHIANRIGWNNPQSSETPQ